MKLSIFYLVCFLMSATPPTHSEFHTAFGPVEGVMVPQRTLHALDAMIEVVQVDLSIPQVAWVERASLDTLLGEISLSRSAGLQSSTVLEAGNLLNADLMFTPSFDLERREVRFDLIEVKRGSRIGTVRQKVDVNRAGTPQIGPRVLDEMSGKLAALLEQGIGIVEADPKPLVVAPLFVRHSGLDPRLDTLAPDLYQNLVTLAGTEELRMLNFAGAGAGREETKLNLLGIARVNPDSWKELADLYVWVEVESPEVEAGKLFEELRLSVHVWVWTGAGEPQSRRFPLSVGQLDHLPDRVRAFCAEVAKSTIPNAAPDPNARDRIAQSLILQSEPVLSKLKSLSPEEYILPRNVRLYRNAMAVLETAAFFTPRDLELEKRILQDRWKYYPVPNRKENIPYALRKAEEYLDFAVKKSLTNGALQPGNDAHLQPLYPLRDAFELLENASWSGRIDPYIAYALQSDLVDTYIRYCGNLVQRFEPGHIYSMKRVLQEARDFGITMLEGGRNGPEFVVKCVESFDGKPFQGDFRVLRAYNSFLAGAEFLDIYEKMKTTEPQSRPAIPHPTPTPQAKSQRSRQQPRIRTREEDTWQPILQVEKSPIPAPDIPGVRPKVVSFWEQEYVKTPRSREPISDWHVGYRDPVDRVLVHNEHRIHALHTDGRILYIGETTSRPVPDSELNQQKGKNHYGWAFDTLGHDLRDLNRLVDNPQGHQEKGHINASQLEKQPYPIRAIFRDHQTLYVGLDGGGIRTLDLENGKVDTVEASRGLTIKTVLGFSAHSGNLYAIGRWDSEVRLVRKPEGDPNFYPLPPWPGRSNGPRRARPMPPRLRSRGRGFEAHPAVTVKAFGSWVAASVGSKLHFLNTETGKWENPRFPSHATIQTITAYRNSLYVGTEMGLYRIYQPPSATEFRVSRIIEGNITALNVQDDHMWVTLVLEPRDALEAARYKRGRTSLHGNSEIALLDLASKTWIGKVHIPGFRLTMLARTGNQLWLASDVTSGPLLQLDTDKFGIAADELPFESPDILFPSRPLLAAARSGNVESVQNLLDEGEDPDQVTSRGWSALMIAADRGHEQVVQMLLEKGVSIDGTLSDGLGAIQLASAGGHLDVVRVLVEAGVDINSKGAPSRFYVPDPRNADYFPDLPPPRPRPEPPAQPRNVRAVQDEYGRISITWVPETPGAAFYEIRRYPATNGKIDPKHFRYNAVIGKVDRHTDHFLDTPYWTPYTRINAWFRSERFLVHPDTEYVYYVVARNRVERSWEQPETPSLPAGIRTTASFMPHPDARTFIEMELANKILEGGEAIDGFARGWSPLALAVISGHLELAKWLVLRGADLESRDQFLRTPLLLAAEVQDLEMMRFLIEAGADTDAVDVEEHTLWDMAYTLRSKALFDLAKKARVSLLRGRGLSKAVQSGRVEDVREILSHARDVQHAHCDGLTYATDEIVDLLYDAATPPDGDWSTRLPARMSSYTTNSFDIGIQAIENQNSRMLFRLLQTPVDLTRLSRKQTNDGWLHSCQYDKYLEAAIEVDSPGMVTILLEAGKSRGLEFQDWILEGVKSDDVRALLDPEGNFHPQPTVVENSEVMTTSERESPLERNARLIQELDRGKQTSYYLQNAYKVGPYLPIEFRVPSMASVKALFDQPVHLAARRGDLEAVKREIEKGVDLNARGEKGWPVLICALDQGHVDVARWLIREGAEVNMVTHLGSAALAYAAKTGDIELLHEMLQYGADPNVFRNFSHTVLTIACSDADLQVVRFLVDHGAHINLANVNYSRWSVNPLRAAVGANRQEVVTFLLDRGADINAQEIKIEDSPLKTVPEINYGPTALIHAGWEQRDDVEMARLLVERGADISLTFNGQTAEEVARERGNHKVAEYLSGLKNR